MKLLKHNSLFFLVCIAFVLVLPYGCKKKGCIYENAINFDKDAEKDDGSCVFSDSSSANGQNQNAILGCTDTSANNYNPNATADDGSCTYSGCTDITAENYNPNATTDDGSCVYARDKFIGEYTVTNDCGFILSVGASSTISSDNLGGDTVSISNLVQGEALFAIASGTQLNIFSQSSGLGGLTTVSGTGVLNGNQIDFTLSYNVNNPFQPITGSCSVEFSK